MINDLPIFELKSWQMIFLQELLYEFVKLKIPQKLCNSDFVQNMNVKAILRDYDVSRIWMDVQFPELFG